MNASFSYYDILGVSAAASQDEIKAAYRAAMRKYHPDVNSAPNAQRLSELLNAAYEVLSDPEKRAQYDAGNNGAVDAEEVEETWDLYVCDRCGIADPHLRLAIFFRVWSILIYSQMSPDGGVLCPQCRSSLASKTALFSAFFGPWGFPWGIFYTIRALLAAVRLGELPRQQNAALLRHQGVAYLQRGYVNEARTAFEASRQFERHPAVDSVLREEVFRVSTIFPKHGWLRGQSVALLSWVIAPVVVLSLFALIGASESQISAMDSTPSPRATSSDDAEVAALFKTCFDANNGDAAVAYRACGSAISWAKDDEAHATGDDHDGDRYAVDRLSVMKAVAAYRIGKKGEARSLFAQGRADLHALVRTSGSSKIRADAQRALDCYERNQCGPSPVPKATTASVTHSQRVSLTA